MASLFRNSDGTFSLQFTAADGSRPTVRVSKTKREATEVKGKVEQLIACKLAGVAMSPDLAVWVGSLGVRLRKQLERHGLIGPRVEPEQPIEAVVPSLGEFWDGFIAIKATMKPTTRHNFDRARKDLTRFFGEARAIDITAGDAEEWFESVRVAGYAAATMATYLKKARQVFGHAVKKEILQKNPFLGVKLPTMANKSREEFVGLDTIAKVIDAAPDAEWRTLIALARYGGLRTPTESLALEWPAVDWDKGRVTIRSPKKEHMPDGGVRVIPLFPELRAYLEEAFEQAAEGARYVITRYRDPAVNLRTQFLRIIARAGVKPWGRLWQNLRSSRETELMQHFPAHVVCEWIGNTEAVAKKHYLQVTDTDFERAIKPVQNPVHFPVQSASASTRQRSHDQGETVEKPQYLLAVANAGEDWRDESVPPRGLEPLS